MSRGSNSTVGFRSATIRAAYLIGFLATVGCHRIAGLNLADAGGDSADDSARDVAADAPGDGPAADAPGDGPAVDAPGDGPAGDGAVASSAVDIGLDLGHVSSIAAIESAGARTLSLDDDRHWVLWNLDTGTQLATATAPCQLGGVPAACLHSAASLHGTTAASLTRMALEVRDASTGTLTATIAVPATDWDHSAGAADLWRWGHASDGSYVWIATKSSLRAWSSTGVSLVTIAGDYAAAKIFAAPGTMRIADGAAGSNVMELVDVATQARTTFAYAGSFHSWFLDGERFLSVIGTAVRVYAKTGSLLAFESLPTVESLGGVGDNVWTYQSGTPGYPLRIYTIAALSTPAQTYNLAVNTRVIPSMDSLGLIPYGAESFEIVTLGASIAKSATIPVPVPYLTAYGGSATRWLIGNHAGVIFDSANLAGDSATWRALSWGAVTSIAGTASTTAALATASGRTVLLNIGAVSTVMREVSAMTSHLELSADATLLVGGPYTDGSQYHDDRSLRVISVATGATMHSWSYRWSTYPTELFDFTFAPVGLVLCHVIAEYQTATWTSRRVLTDIAGTVLPDYGPTNVGNDPARAHAFSPDGTKATILASTSPETTQIYNNGTLTGAVDGRTLTWLGDTQILVAKYTGNTQPTLASVKTYDTTGTLSSTTALSQVSGRVSDVGAGLIYMQGANAVFNYQTGTKVWQGDADVRNGAVVGDYILFSRGPRVLTDRFR